MKWTLDDTGNFGRRRPKVVSIRGYKIVNDKIHKIILFFFKFFKVWAN